MDQPDDAKRPNDEIGHILRVADLEHASARSSLLWAIPMALLALATWRAYLRDYDTCILLTFCMIVAFRIAILGYARSGATQSLVREHVLAGRYRIWYGSVRNKRHKEWGGPHIHDAQLHDDGILVGTTWTMPACPNVYAAARAGDTIEVVDTPDGALALWPTDDPDAAAINHFTFRVTYHRDTAPTRAALDSDIPKEFTAEELHREPRWAKYFNDSVWQGVGYPPPHGTCIGHLGTVTNLSWGFSSGGSYTNAWINGRRVNVPRRLYTDLRLGEEVWVLTFRNRLRRRLILPVVSETQPLHHDMKTP